MIQKLLATKLHEHVLLDGIAFKGVAFPIEHITAELYARIDMSNETTIVIDVKIVTNTSEAAMRASERRCTESESLAFNDVSKMSRW